MTDFTFHYKYQSPGNLDFRFWNGYLELYRGGVSYTYKPGDVVAFYEKTNVDALRVMTDYHDSSYWSSKTFYSNRELPGLEDYLVASDSVFNSYSMSFINCNRNSSIPYNYSCPLNSSVESSQGLVSSEQVSGMGTAVTTAGSGLLHIGIQLMPYAIVFTIILLIFGLIKNWGKLRNKWGVEPPVNMLGESWARKHPKAYDCAFRRWDRRSSRRLARKYGGNRKDYYSGKAG